MHRLSIQNQRTYLYFFVQLGATRRPCHVFMASWHHEGFLRYSPEDMQLYQVSHTETEGEQPSNNGLASIRTKKTIRIFSGSRLEIGLLWGGKMICPHKNPKEYRFGGLGIILLVFICHLLHLRVLSTQSPLGQNAKLRTPASMVRTIAFTSVPLGCPGVTDYP